MNYLLLLYGDASQSPAPGTPEFDAMMAGYAAFGELAGDRIAGGEALHDDNASCRTIRHDGGNVHVTDGPFAETVEGLGGFYVIDAPTLDDAIELARYIPAANDGAVEIRPMVQWFDRKAELAPLPEGASRYLATIHGPAIEAEVPGTPAWDAAAAEHGRFVATSGDAVDAGGAVQPASSASTVRVRDGELLVTDGPFSEATRVVGGFYILRGTPDDVEKVARGIPVNPAGAVQLRLVMEFDM